MSLRCTARTSSAGEPSLMVREISGPGVTFGEGVGVGFEPPASYSHCSVLGPAMPSTVSGWAGS